MPAPTPLPRSRPPEPNTPLPQPWLPPPRLRRLVMTVNGNSPDAKGNVKISIPEVVTPSEDGAGKAADAKATYEALENKVAKSELDSLVVAPDSSAKTGQAADAKATYEELKTKRSIDDLDYTRTETSLEPGYVLEIYNLDKTQLLNTVNLKLISERHSGAFVTKVWEYRTDNTQYQLTGELAGYDSYDWRFIASDEYGIFFAPTWHTSLLDGLETDHTVTGTNCVYELQYSESIEFTNPVDDKLALVSQIPNIEIVTPSSEGEGKAADAKATYEALKELDEKINSGGGSVSSLVIDTTYAELKAWRDSGTLTPGMRYRITDFIPYENEMLNFEEKVTYRVESSGRRYDIIITAITNNSLNDYVKAAAHEGTTYYTDGLLSQWQMWYNIDITSYDGVAKGCIYRMIDEHGNDLPYDFKNIYFRLSGQDDGEPTFAHGSDVSGFVVKHNGRYPNYRLVKVLADSYVSTVIIGADSHLITFSGVVSNCTIGKGCSEVSITNSQNITVGCEAEEITIADCKNITIGNDSYYFGIGQCENVNIESSCGNIFLSYTKRSTVGFGCDNIHLQNGRQVTVGNNCQYIAFGKSTVAADLYPIWNAIIEDTVAQLTFTGKPASASALMNFTIKSGVGGKTITASATNKLYSAEYTTIRPTGSYTYNV